MKEGIIWFKVIFKKNYHEQNYRYILEARKRALAKKKKLRTLGKRTRSVESEDEVEEDGIEYTNIVCHKNNISLILQIY